MAKPDYRAPLEPAPKKPFAVQAAQFAFWAPIASMIVGLAIRPGDSSYMPAAATVVIAVIQLALVVASLVLGVAALFGIRRHGAKGILVRSLIGILISGLVIGFTVYLMFFLRPADLIARRLVGQWETTLHTPAGVEVKNHLALNADRHASAQLTVNDKSLTVNGTWGVLWDRNAKSARLAVKWDAGTDPQMGDGVVWGIEHVEADQITLQGKNGETVTHEVYLRTGK